MNTEPVVVGLFIEIVSLFVMCALVVMFGKR